MQALEIIVQQISSIQRQLSRRSFLKMATFAVVVSGVSLEDEESDFLRRVAATLIPMQALESTGIDVVANINQLLKQGSAGHRKKVLRLLASARRASFFYGGDKVAMCAQGSRFMLVRKRGKALLILMSTFLSPFSRQFSRERVYLSCQDFLPLIDDPPVSKINYPVTVSGILFGVRHLNDGCPFSVKALEQLHDLFALA